MEDERLKLCHYDKVWNTPQLEKDERRVKEGKMGREGELIGEGRRHRQKERRS